VNLTTPHHPQDALNALRSLCHGYARRELRARGFGVDYGVMSTEKFVAALESEKHSKISIKTITGEEKAV
jgi:hypothetical protein